MDISEYSNADKVQWLVLFSATWSTVRQEHESAQPILFGYGGRCKTHHRRQFSIHIRRSIQSAVPLYQGMYVPATT